VDAGGAHGVLCALGDWHGGWALYAFGGRLAFTFSRAGEPLRVVSAAPIPPGRHRLAVSGAGARFALWCDDVEIGALAFEGGLPFALQHGGTALCLGYDRGFPVVDDYSPPAPWNGTLHEVVVESGAPVPVADVRGALHAD